MRSGSVKRLKDPPLRAVQAGGESKSRQSAAKIGVGPAAAQLAQLVGLAMGQVGVELFQLLAEKKLKPRIADRMPLLEARAANERLERGAVDGKIVMVA